ncbi:MAG: hypothetical protein QM783_21215 [Phycisphaerales bacterium]
MKDEVVQEGKALYKSEMASWYGTDVFMAKFSDRQQDIGGYVSYTEDKVSKCIFFSKGTEPKVLSTISFDETFNVETAGIDGKERELSPVELSLVNLRNLAKQQIMEDTMFVRYKKINFNIIPMIRNGEKKVYVLSGPEENGVMIFGNDYLLTFDKKDKLKEKKKLHKNIMPFEFGNKDIVSGIHSHLPETGELITATDICTLMLYEKFAKIKSYYVVSKEYVSIWDCKTDSLAIMTTEAWKKISGKTIEGDVKKD